MVMDKLDRWTRLLGTVLVKVSFVDPISGHLVDKNQGGIVQLDLLHGGVYDVRHGASPYYITELLIGFGNSFGGFSSFGKGKDPALGATVTTKGAPSPSNYGTTDALFLNRVGSNNSLKGVNQILWTPDAHMQIDEEGNAYQVKNPYGTIPAVAFFNQDPAHYYFLPINEPLIYANHTLNMRLTDLNHIAKFQSFGVPVLTGVERPTSLRQGRPSDDFNQLKGGLAQSRFGGISGMAGFGAGGQFRSFDSGLGIFRDGNADANALGFSIGPDTAIAVGEHGDFKFAHPSADINGLINAIHSMSDIVRINHGLKPKYRDNVPPSGFALWLEKAGVIDENRRRSKLFKEREQQLFNTIKMLYNAHHSKSGDRKFSEDARLEVTYIEPKFPIDPKTKIEEIIMEQKVMDSGSRDAYRKLYPHLSDSEINKKIKEYRKDKEEKAKADAEIEVEKAKILAEAQIISMQATESVQSEGVRSGSTKNITYENQAATVDKEDNKLKHAQKSSNQPKPKDTKEEK